MLGLPAKHNNVFHCFFEGALPGRARFARSNTSSLQTHQKTYLYTPSVFDNGVTRVTAG